mmetsp:Transcript_8028/g.10589  ORF Transcript_8028/g.10589 Transcript_8028/m.10589 type:complete len:197 (+) Transcript_8028:924-1514(+)
MDSSTYDKRLILKSGQTKSFYVMMNDPNLRYTDTTNFSAEYLSNDHLILYEGTGVGNWWGGEDGKYLYHPRTWNDSIRYKVIQLSPSTESPTATNGNVGLLPSPHIHTRVAYLFNVVHDPNKFSLPILLSDMDGNMSYFIKKLLLVDKHLKVYADSLGLKVMDVEPKEEHDNVPCKYIYFVLYDSYNSYPSWGDCL